MSGKELLEIKSLMANNLMNHAYTTNLHKNFKQQCLETSSWWLHLCDKKVGCPKLYEDRSSCAQDLSKPHPMYLFFYIMCNKPVH